jgi:hypothetical protein
LPHDTICASKEATKNMVDRTAFSVSLHKPQDIGIAADSGESPLVSPGSSCPSRSSFATATCIATLAACGVSIITSVTSAAQLE